MQKTKTKTKTNSFLHFKHKYLATYNVKAYEISSRHYHTSLVQDPTITYAIKKQFLKYFAPYNRNDSFEWNLIKNIP